MKIQSVRFVLGAAGWNDLPSDNLPEVAFIGRSNVGKSSLINLLVGRKGIARTSNTPGKTQQFNYYLANERFYLVDLPGFGYAKISKQQRAFWGRLIGRYLTERIPLRCVFHLVDSRHPPTSLDQDVMALMKGSPVPYVVVLTKTDKLKRNDVAKSRRRAEQVLESFGLEVAVLMSSSTKGQGRNEILSWIEDLI